MKTKLLKKIRQRYVITYYPREIKLYSSIFRGQCMTMWDKKEEYRFVGIEIGETRTFVHFQQSALTKEEAKKILLKRMIDWIRTDYSHTYKKKKQNVELIWYSEK